MERPQVVIPVLVAIIVLSTSAGSGQESIVRRLTVREAVGLCPSGKFTRVGSVTVEGYPGTVRSAIVTVQGLFPTREAALRQSRSVAPVFPPTEHAVWLHGGRVPGGARTRTVTGNLSCFFQLPGMGDNRGTFAWLTIQKQKAA